MTDLWTILRADHDQIRDLLDQLNSSPAMTVDGVDERQAIAQELIAAVSSHEAAEELAIWGAVRQCCPIGADLVRHVLPREQQLIRGLDRLAGVSAADERFDGYVRRVGGLLGAFQIRAGRGLAKTGRGTRRRRRQPPNRRVADHALADGAQR